MAVSSACHDLSHQCDVEELPMSDQEILHHDSYHLEHSRCASAVSSCKHDAGLDSTPEFVPASPGQAAAEPPAPGDTEDEGGQKPDATTANQGSPSDSPAQQQAEQRFFDKSDLDEEDECEARQGRPPTRALSPTEERSKSVCESKLRYAEFLRNLQATASIPLGIPEPAVHPPPPVPRQQYVEEEFVVPEEAVGPTAHVRRAIRVPLSENAESRRRAERAKLRK
eukprot:m51a1_g11004 hypothetical protein (225) ;mRNA; r:361617-362741